jgi:hypothetical protein
MQATQDVTRNAQPSPQLYPKASRLPEYVYRAAILLAVVILLWTVV